MMKVDRPDSGKALSGKKRISGSAASSDGSSFADSLSSLSASDEAGGAASLSGPAGTQATSSLDMILAMQGSAGDDDAAQKRAKMRAEALLRHLEAIHGGLLMGGIPKASLIGLARDLKTLRDHVVDPKLLDVLDAIDLRAQVELAKHDPFR